MVVSSLHLEYMYFFFISILFFETQTQYAYLAFKSDFLKIDWPPFISNIQILIRLQLEFAFYFDKGRLQFLYCFDKARITFRTPFDKARIIFRTSFYC